MRWLVGVMWVGVAAAQPAPVAAPGSAPASAPATLGVVPVEADWKARAMAWFKDAADDKARKEAMREITQAIKQPCRHCHTPDFTGYTDVQPIARQMMALSVEHGVTCADCHLGKTELTPLGQKSVPMWALSHEKKVFCDHCHVPAKRFLELTPAGQTHKAEQSKKTP